MFWNILEHIVDKRVHIWLDYADQICQNHMIYQSHKVSQTTAKNETLP